MLENPACAEPLATAEAVGCTYAGQKVILSGSIKQTRLTSGPMATTEAAVRYVLFFPIEKHLMCNYQHSLFCNTYYYSALLYNYISYICSNRQFF